MRLEKNSLEDECKNNQTALIRIRKIKIQKKKRFIDEKVVDCLDLRKARMVVECKYRESASIKSFAVKKRNKSNHTILCWGNYQCFQNDTLKISFMIFQKPFVSHRKKIVDLNKKYLIEKVQFFHILTDKDSTALKFIFISDPNSDLPEDKFRDVTFEFIVTSKIYKRFDTSHDSYT